MTIHGLQIPRKVVNRGRFGCQAISSPRPLHLIMIPRSFVDVRLESLPCGLPVELPLDIVVTELLGGRFENAASRHRRSDGFVEEGSGHGCFWTCEHGLINDKVGRELRRRILLIDRNSAIVMEVILVHIHLLHSILHCKISGYVSDSR